MHRRYRVTMRRQSFEAFAGPHVPYSHVFIKLYAFKIEMRIKKIKIQNQNKGKQKNSQKRTEL